MKRREIVLTLFALVLATASISASAQSEKPKKIPVLGILSPNVPPTPQQVAENAKSPIPITRKLGELGWVAGKNLMLEFAYGGDREDRLPGLAAELVRKQVDVIYASGADAAVAAARATKTIPIVFVGVALPVELGLIDSLARPGRNVTGVAFYVGRELVWKQLELLKEIAPKVVRVAWVSPPDSLRTVAGTQIDTFPADQSAARRLGLQIRQYHVRSREDFDAVFAAIRASRAQAIATTAQSLLFRERERIVAFANRHHLASAFLHQAFAESGGLVSYGADQAQAISQSAVYIDRILRGAKPGEIPVELPSRYELVVNKRTARALGLTIPQPVLLRADRVIE